MAQIKVLEMILPVIVMIALGAITGKTKMFNRNDIAAIKKLAINITLTAVLFQAFAKAEYKIQSLIIPLIMFGICFLLWALGKVIVKARPNLGIYLPYIMTGFEAGMLGYTLYTILYGVNDIGTFAIVDLGQTLFVFTFYKIMVSKDTAKRNINVLKEIAYSPILYGVAAGILVGVTGLYSTMQATQIVGLFDSVVGFVAAPTSALILLSIGYDLVTGRIAWGKAIKFVFIRYVVLLAVAFGFIGLTHLLFGENLALDRAILLMFLLPPPFVLPVFADDPEEQSTIASILSLSTLVTIIAFIILAGLAV